MNFADWGQELLAANATTRIIGWRCSFASPWGHDAPALVFVACLLMAAMAFTFYFRFQPAVPRRAGMLLATLRAVLLSLMVLILADPVCELTHATPQKPELWLLLDGSESMNISDPAAPHASSKLNSRINGNNSTTSDPLVKNVSRGESVRSLFTQADALWLRDLSQKFELKAFSFQDAQSLQSLLSDEAMQDITAETGQLLATAWTTTGKSTAIGDALNKLANREAIDRLAGVVVISDFNQNAGAEPIAAAKNLGVPIMTVGIGPSEVLDLSVNLSAPPTMKKGETSTVTVAVQQQGFDSRTVEVRLSMRIISPSGQTPPPKKNLETRSVVISAGSVTLDFSVTPDQVGDCVIEAEVDPLPSETMTENNRSERNVTVLDDFLRLLYVEYEPTWEWRFLKEVFHRDKLVGTRGFRTFLRSADPVVRETNELFLPSLNLPRREFFQTDVIFLGDMPASALSSSFCEMTKEFVSQFGGGLVVIAGPRFGLGELAATPIAEMLPVVIDPAASPKDDGEFRLQLSPIATQFDFMKLDSGDKETTQKTWDSLGKLPWYQPVLQPEPRSTLVLAEHPTALCKDGQTKQPLIAVRKYGRGEVVYLGFNELWRFRRLHGDTYYRQFWGQLIYRLGLSHPVGSQKRFVVQTDQRTYRKGDQATITVEAYDRDYRPLSSESLPNGQLSAKWFLSGNSEITAQDQPFSIPELRPGYFVAHLPLNVPGEYHIQITDPITLTPSEVRIDVAETSLERSSAIRNVSLERSLAAETGGKTYDLTTVSQLLKDFSPSEREEQSVEIVPLWSTTYVFMIVVGCMCVEWFGRKLVNLT